MRDFAQARDMKVLEALENYRYMRSDQIAELYFTSIKDRGQRVKKTSERMKKLHSKGFVKRFRFGCEPFIYTVDGVAYSNKIQHYLTVVDVLIELQKIKPVGSSLRWETEKKFEDLICDLHLEYRNEFRNKRKDYFIEVELDSSGDILQKVNKYSRLIRSRKREGTENDVLYILCSKLPVVKKIGAVNFDINVIALPLKEFESKWQW